MESKTFLRQHGVLPSSVTCPNCNNKCSLHSDRPIWKCNRKIKVAKRRKFRRCGFCTSDYKGSFAEHCHFAVWKLVLFINAWLNKRFTHYLVISNSNITRETLVNWRSYCSDVTEYFLDNQPAISGPEVIVETD